MYAVYDTTVRCRTLPHDLHSTAGKICDYFMFGELHLGLKDVKLLHEGILSLTPDIPLNRVVMDLNKLSTAISSRLSLDNSLNIGGYAHHLCANDVNELARITQHALDDIKPISLTTLGRKHAEKRVVSWVSALTDRAEEVWEMHVRE